MTCEVRARRRAGLLRGLAAATCIAVLATPVPAHAAGSDLLTGVLAEPGGAGLGGGLRIERSMYRDAGTRNDLLPLYMYDGKHIYLHAYRFGLKLDRSERTASTCSSSTASKDFRTTSAQPALRAWAIASRAWTPA